MEDYILKQAIEAGVVKKSTSNSLKTQTNGAKPLPRGLMKYAGKRKNKLPQPKKSMGRVTLVLFMQYAIIIRYVFRGEMILH